MWGLSAWGLLSSCRNEGLEEFAFDDFVTANMLQSETKYATTAYYYKERGHAPLPPHAGQWKEANDIISNSQYRLSLFNVHGAIL